MTYFMLKYKKSARCVVAFFLGALVLILLSAIQKLIAGFPFTVKSFVIPFSYGGFVGILLCLWYNRLKDKEDDLRRAKQEAEHANNLKGRFLANLSHEIRTPLNGIIGFSGLLDNDQLNAEKRKRYIELIQISSQRFLRTVNNLVDISLLTKEQNVQQKNRINLNHLMEEHRQKAINLLQQDNKTDKISVKFTPRTEDACYNVLCDQALLDRVLNEIIINAVQFTHSGEIVLSYETLGNNCVNFIIMDTGIGMPRHVEIDAFDLFSASLIDAENQGSGLGLAIAKSIVGVLRGKIWFDSQLGKGTRFYISIPMQFEKQNHR